MVWDDQTICQLRDFWTQGHSTAEIGRRLGVSKNAIVGKAHRLELDARPSPIRRDAVKPVADRSACYPRMAGPTLPPLASANDSAIMAPTQPANVQPMRLPVAIAPRPMPPAQPVPMVPRPIMPRPVTPPAPVPTRRPAPSCCWPIGEPGTKTFRFCDDFSMPGKPYCEEHAKLAYVRIRDRKEDAA